jgi:hypothetical protein
MYGEMAATGVAFYGFCLMYCAVGVGGYFFQ